MFHSMLTRSSFGSDPLGALTVRVLDTPTGALAKRTRMNASILPAG